MGAVKAKENPVKMDRVIASPTRNKDEEWVGHGHRSFPFDLPVMMSVSRWTGKSAKRSDLPTVAELTGWTLKVHLVTFRKTLQINIYRKPKMVKVLLEDEVIAIIEAPSEKLSRKSTKS